MEEAQKFYDDSSITIVDVLKILNLAVEKDDCYETRLERGLLYYFQGYLDEAEKDLKVALQFEEGMDALSYLLGTEQKLYHTNLAIEIGEKIRRRKKEDAFWHIDACILTCLYIDDGQLAKAEALMNECELEADGQKHREWIAELRASFEEEKKNQK